MNARHWITYFTENRHAFAEPDWEGSGTADTCALRRDNDPRLALLIRSLATFQLGESGGGTRLMRFVRRESIHLGDARTAADYEFAISLFVAEEQYHAELLARLVHYLGGDLLRKHWMNAVFRGVRNVVNLDFNIQVLLTAELIAEAYYGFLHRCVDDPVIHRVTGKILADEVRHIAFHGEFFRARNRGRLPVAASLWALQFQGIFLATEHAVWSDHGRCLSAFGVGRSEFSTTARGCCRRFLEAVLTPGSRRRARVITDLPPQTESV